MMEMKTGPPPVHRQGMFANANGTSTTTTTTGLVTGVANPNAIIGGVGGGGMMGAKSECAACQRPIKERFLLKALDQLWHEDCLKCACCDCRLGEVGSTLFTKANLILCRRDYLRLFGTTGMCSACNKTIPAFEMVMRVRGGRVYHLECFQCSQCSRRFCIGDRFHLYENQILCEYDYEDMAAVNAGGGGGATPAAGGGGALFNSPVSQFMGTGSSSASHIDKLKKQTDSLVSSPAGLLAGGGGGIAGGGGGGAVGVGGGGLVNGLGAAPMHILVAGVHDDGSSGYGSPDSLLSDGK